MSLLTVSQEGLYDFRAPLLAGNIEEALNKAKAAKLAGQDWMPKLKSTLDKLILTQFGISANIVWNTSPLGLESLASVRYFVLTDESLRVNELRRYSDEEHAEGKGIAAAEAVYSGWYDESKHKVGGVFSKIPVIINLHVDTVDYEPHVLGILLLHEVGHFMDYAWTISNQYRYLSVIESLVRGIRGSKNAVTAAKLAVDTMGKYGVTIENPEELKGAQSDDTLRTVLLASYNEYAAVLMQRGRSIFRGEQIADDLSASIYGARRTGEVLAHFITSLEKHSLIKIAAVSASLMVVAGVVIGLGAFILLPIVVGFNLMSITSSVPQTHPNIDDRCRHLRNLMMSEAKKPRMTREELETLSAGIAALDDIIDRYDTLGKRMRYGLSKFMSEFSQHHFNIYDIDMMYEELSMNPLYLRSHQLNNLKEQRP